MPATLEVDLDPAPRGRHDKGGEDEGGRPRVNAIGSARPAPEIIEQEDLPVPGATGRGATVAHGEARATRAAAQGRPLPPQAPFLSAEIPMGDRAPAGVTPPVGRRVPLVPHDAEAVSEGVPEVEGPVRRRHGPRARTATVGADAVGAGRWRRRAPHGHPMEGRVGAAQLEPLPATTAGARLHSLDGRSSSLRPRTPVAIRRVRRVPAPGGLPPRLQKRRLLGRTTR